MADNHIIVAGYGGCGCGYTKTRPAYQYDYGQVLQLDGFPEGMLPDAFEMHFSIGHGEAITRIGTGGAVAIPNVCLERFGTVTCWLFLHDAETDGETRYVIEIPVRSRAKTTDQEPTPAEQSVITEAIAALNSGVTAAAGSAEDAAEAAEDAAEARDAAEAAADSVMHAAATAETLPAGSSATASVSNVEGVITFELGIPKGDKGDQGDRGEPGYAVVQVSATQPQEEINKLWIVDGGGATEIEMPSYAEFQELQEDVGGKLDAPDAAGTSGQVLTSDGQGGQSWGNPVDVSGKADKTDTVLTTTLSRGRKENTFIGNGSIAFGTENTASGQFSSAFGSETVASGPSSHSHGLSAMVGTTIRYTTASGTGSHAEGGGTLASGGLSHSEGAFTTASGDDSHAEGFQTTSSGMRSHAEGEATESSGRSSHSEGVFTIANHKSQHVSGEYNIADPSAAASNKRGTYVEIVGNGTGANDRSNARTLDWNGNETLAGDLKVNAGTANEVSVSDLAADVGGKQDAPAAAGTSGQVLGLNSSLEPVWMTPQGGSGGAQIDDTAGIGDTTKVWSADKNERERQTLNSAINSLPEIKESDTEDVDLDVSDPNGNVILRLEGGHIKTKKFDSSNIDVDSDAGIEVKNSNATDVTLDIADQSGRVVARFANGGIETKNFNSGAVNGKISNLEEAVFPESKTTVTVSTAADLLDEIENGTSDIIVIANGTYNVLNIEVNRNVEIVGQSRTRVILNSDGTTDTDPNRVVTDRHGIRFNKGGALRNLTFNVNDVKYIFHQDNINVEYDLLIENCTFNRYDDSCGYYFFIGCGCRGKQNITVKNCSFIFSNNTHDIDTSAVYWHNWHLAKGALCAYTAELTIENCGCVGCEIVYAQDISDKTANDIVSVLSCTSTETAPVTSGANGHYIDVTNENVPYNIVFVINSKIGNMTLIDRSSSNYVYLQSAVDNFV